VLLVHGDDDRNVAFQQTTGLVQLLRQRDVHDEAIVFPDDMHESMLHAGCMRSIGWNGSSRSSSAGRRRR
jgi:hypothetical protein